MEDNEFMDRLVALMSSPANQNEPVASQMAAIAAHVWDELADVPTADLIHRALELGVPEQRAKEMADLPAEGRAVVFKQIAQIYRQKSDGFAEVGKTLQATTQRGRDLGFVVSPNNSLPR